MLGRRCLLECLNVCSQIIFHSFTVLNNRILVVARRRPPCQCPQSRPLSSLRRLSMILRNHFLNLTDFTLPFVLFCSCELRKRHSCGICAFHLLFHQGATCFFLFCLSVCLHLKNSHIPVRRKHKWI